MIWLAIISAIIVSIYRLLVTFMDKSVFLQKPYVYLPFEDWVTNLLIFWSLTLLLASCHLWRQALSHKRELEIIIASVSPDVLAVVTPDRTLTMINPAVKVMFGYEPSEVLQKKTEVLYFDRRSGADKREVFHSLEKFGFHMGYATGRRKNGETFPIEIVTGDLEGRRGAVVLIRDITIRKCAEEQNLVAKEEAEKANLEKSKALAELGQNYAKLKELEALRDNLVHMVVHDMKTPISGIGTSLEMLSRDARPRLSPVLNSCLDSAIGFNSDLVNMVQSLLDVSRMEAGELPLAKAPIDVSLFINDALRSVESLRCEKDMRFGWTVRPLEALCDREVMGRVLANLLSNALKFAPAASEVRIAVQRDGSNILVAVTDSGPGVPAEFHRKIFEKFGRVETQKRGKDYSTGLGLTFCKLAVEAHGGQIGVESPVQSGNGSESRGSTFWFTLPAA